ncbi:MAG: tetratricopeptide repeat protein [Alphaproteobacteria bacterium]|nr:tetratricopeptide repeat protein [Alphaproteobacteria bacterium]
MSLDVFREVNEEYRREQFLAFCQQHKKWLILIACTVLAIGVLYAGWHQVKAKRLANQAIAFSSALNQLAVGNSSAAQAAFEQLASQQGGYAALAKLHLADLQEKANDRDAALKGLKAMADDGSVDMPLRHYARYIVAQRMLGQGGGTVDPAAIEAWLKPLMVKGNAWEGLAMELVGLAFIQADQMEAARKQLQALVERKDVAIDTRDRAQGLLTLVHSRLGLAAPNNIISPDDARADDALNNQNAISQTPALGSTNNAQGTSQ